MSDLPYPTSAIAATDGQLLTAVARKVGKLERLPKWLNLVPMVIQWLWLAIRYQSVTLPSSANPAILAGGLRAIDGRRVDDGCGARARERDAGLDLLRGDGCAGTCEGGYSRLAGQAGPGRLAIGLRGDGDWSGLLAENQIRMHPALHDVGFRFPWNVRPSDADK